MTEKLVILDGGFFVSRMAKHWAPKGRFTRWMAKVERGKMVYPHYLNRVRKTIFQDLNYIQMRINQAGYYGIPVQVCYDGSRGRNHRGKLYSHYKANRVPDSKTNGYDAGDYTNRDIRDDFENLGLKAMSLRKKFIGHYDEALEADDLMADMVVNHPDHDIIIFTQDSDLHQLLKVKSDLKFHNFTESVDPTTSTTFSFDLYADWKAMAGDASDNIPGVPNLGPKKATQLVLEHGTLETIPLEVFNRYRVALGYQNDARKVLKTFRDQNEKSEAWAKRKYGVAWMNIETEGDTELTQDQYQKLVAADCVEEIWFTCESFFDTIKNYREIINLPSQLYTRT